MGTLTHQDVNLRGNDGEKSVPISVDQFGKLKIDNDGELTALNERLKIIEDTMKLILLHAQVVTGEEFTLDDFNIERG